MLNNVEIIYAINGIELQDITESYKYTDDIYNAVYYVLSDAKNLDVNILATDTNGKRYELSGDLRQNKWTLYCNSDMEYIFYDKCGLYESLEEIQRYFWALEELEQQKAWEINK